MPSTLAEGDGRHPVFSQQQMGSAEGVVDHVNRESSAFERKPPFPEGISHRRNMGQEDRDQVIFVCFPVRAASFTRLAITRQGCIECRSASMLKTHGMDGYVLAIFLHIYSLVSVHRVSIIKSSSNHQHYNRSSQCLRLCAPIGSALGQVQAGR